MELFDSPRLLVIGHIIVLQTLTILLQKAFTHPPAVFTLITLSTTIYRNDRVLSALQQKSELSFTQKIMKVQDTLHSAVFIGDRENGDFMALHDAECINRLLV